MGGVIWRGKEAISKRKDYFWARTFFRGGEGKGKSFIIKIASFPWEVGQINWATMTHYFVGANQKIPDWLIHMTCLVKVETAIRLGI